MTPPAAMQIETEMTGVTKTEPAKETRIGTQVGIQNGTARMPRPVRTANIFTLTETGKQAAFATDSWHSLDSACTPVRSELTCPRHRARKGMI